LKGFLGDFVEHIEGDNDFIKKFHSITFNYYQN